MAKQSAGILLYRERKGALEYLLVHPGGPFFKNKDSGWWTIPKGEILQDETPLAAACREFEEETGYMPTGDFIELTPIVQKGGKKVFCWAARGDLNAEQVICNTFELEWPPRSGKTISCAEIDRAAWFNFNEASKKINERQVPLLADLRRQLKM